MNVTSAIVETLKAAAAGEPVLLLGSPGIGKTAVAKILAERLGLPYVEVRPAEFESVDFRGIPTVENGKTRWNIPDFWPTEACVLNFDEITQAPMELTSPLLKLFLGGEIGDYKLPPGTILIASGNLVSDRAGCSRLSSALRERCIVIQLEPDLNEWLGWYQSQGFADDAVVGFLQANPTAFHAWDAKLDFNQPTPRNWARLSRLLANDPAEETVAGVIGPDYARSFMAFRRANVCLPDVWSIIGGDGLRVGPSLTARFVDKLADETTKISDELLVKLVDYVSRELAGTFQVQFLRAVAKRDASILRKRPMVQLVGIHAKAITATK